MQNKMNNNTTHNNGGMHKDDLICNSVKWRNNSQFVNNLQFNIWYGRD